MHSSPPHHAQHHSVYLAAIYDEHNALSDDENEADKVSILNVKLESDLTDAMEKVGQLCKNIKDRLANNSYG